ncbi:MAG: flavodoxin domain-containing protein [Pseudomonadota bacterium]
MNILIIYQTGEGQTLKIARFVEHYARDAGHAVQLTDAADGVSAQAFEGIDKVVLAAPVHERRHPGEFEALVAANVDLLNKHRPLMISVSLKAAFEDGQEEARDYLTEMEMRTGLDPSVEILAAGAVQSDSYDYYQSQIVKHVIFAGQDIDMADGVREFTDWAALTTGVSAFLARP